MIYKKYGPFYSGLSLQNINYFTFSRHVLLQEAPVFFRLKGERRGDFYRTDLRIFFIKLQKMERFKGRKKGWKGWGWEEDQEAGGGKEERRGGGWGREREGKAPTPKSINHRHITRDNGTRLFRDTKLISCDQRGVYRADDDYYKHHILALRVSPVFSRICIKKAAISWDFIAGHL